MEINFCSNCGEPGTGSDTDICTNCGKSLYTQKESIPNRKSQNTNQSLVLAAVLSFVWPGLGQLYNGKYWKGLFFWVCFMTGLVLFFLPGFIIWIYSMWDAYTEAEKINRGEIPFINPSFGDIIAFTFIPIIVCVAVYVILVMVMLSL